MPSNRYDDSTDDTEPEEKPRAWSRWMVRNSWTTTKMLLGKLQRINITSHTEELDTEPEAFQVAAERLLVLQLADRDDDVHVYRHDYRRTDDGRVVRHNQEWLLRADVASLSKAWPAWSEGGPQPLGETLQHSDRFRYDLIPIPSKLSPARREQALAHIRTLRRGLDKVAARSNLVRAPMTPAEYEEAKAAGFDAFGDPGHPPGERTTKRYSPAEHERLMAEARGLTPKETR